MNVDIEERARAVVDAWNGQATEPIRDLRFSPLSAVVALANVREDNILVATAATYRIELRVRTEQRRGASAPSRIDGAATRIDAVSRLPAFRPLPGQITAATLIEEPEEHLIDVEAHPCLPCRGTGHVDCSGCHGTRELPCGSCSGRGQVTQRQVFNEQCSTCNGHGYLVRPCTVCDRRGWNTCDLCEKDANGMALPKACAACGNKRQRSCSTCGGAGELRTYCPPTIAVQRDVSVACPTCHSRRTVSCTTCAARGTVECSTCSGFRQTYLCTLARRVAVLTPVGSWRGGVGASLASATWVTAQIEARTGGRHFDIRPIGGRAISLDQLRDVQSILTPAAEPFLTKVHGSLASRAVEAEDAVLIDTASMSSISFEASVEAWNARFLHLADGSTFADTEAAPTDPEQTRRQHAAYSVWRPTEVLRLEANHQAELVNAAKRSSDATAAALRARPRQRAGLVILGAYLVAIALAWCVIVQIGVPMETSFAGNPRRLDPIYGWFIVAFLAVIPAVLLRRRLGRFIVSGIKAFRTFTPVIPVEQIPSAAPAEYAPHDWAPSEHPIDPDLHDDPRPDAGKSAA